MSSSVFGLWLLTQTLLRGAGWLLLLLLVMRLLKRLSAARRALGWQTAFVGLLLLPLFLLWTPPLALLQPSPIPVAADRAPVLPSHATAKGNGALPAPPWKPEPLPAPSKRESRSQSSSPTRIAASAPAIPARVGFPMEALPAMLLLCWGVGAMGFLVRLGNGLLQLRRLGQSLSRRACGTPGAWER